MRFCVPVSFYHVYYNFSMADLCGPCLRNSPYFNLLSLPPQTPPGSGKAETYIRQTLQGFASQRWTTQRPQFLCQYLASPTKGHEDHALLYHRPPAKLLCPWISDWIMRHFFISSCLSWNKGLCEHSSAWAFTAQVSTTFWKFVLTVATLLLEKTYISTCFC